MSNKLTRMLNDYRNGFPCLMWWPQLQIFTPVKFMGPCDSNAKFLQVEYFKPISVVTNEVKPSKIDDTKSKLKSMVDGQTDNQEKEREEIKFHTKCVSENYNLMDLHVETIKDRAPGSALRNEGLSFDLEASNYIRRQIPNGDKRIGKRNILKMTHTALQFERIFLFFDESEDIDKLTISQRDAQRKGGDIFSEHGGMSHKTISYNKEELAVMTPV